MSRPIPYSSLSQEVQQRIAASTRRSVSARLAWQKRKKATKTAKHHKPVSATLFRALCQQSGLPMPITEYRFASPRRWAWDYCWPDEKLALEVDGGIFVGGAHVRGARILKTHEKLNSAATLGWRILYCVPRNLCTDSTLSLVRHALTGEPK